MKTFVHFMLTSVISTFAFWGGLASKQNPWPGYAVAFGIWGVFLWRYHIRLKMDARRKKFEQQMFRDHMRSKPRYFH